MNKFMTGAKKKLRSLCYIMNRYIQKFTQASIIRKEVVDHPGTQLLESRSRREISKKY
jgi:hypothetical protein